MKNRRILSILLTMVIVLTGALAISSAVIRPSGYHQYPTFEEMKDLPVSSKYEACKIPKYKLRLMSTEQLAQALIDFPFLKETGLYNTGRAGANAILSNSSALQELIKRDDATDILLVKLEKLRCEQDDPFLIESISVILLHTDALANMLTLEEKDMLRQNVIVPYRYE